MKKIAFINSQTFTPWGGSEVLWYESALALKKAGHDVYVYFPKWPSLPKEASKLENAGCKVTYYSFIRGFKEKILSSLGQKSQSERDLKIKTQWLLKVKPDIVVFTRLLPRGKEWMRAALRANIPYVVIGQLADETLWHSAEELEDSADLYAKAKKVYVLSEENKIALVKQLSINLTNIALVYNPFQVDINKPFFYPNLIDGKVHIACVARFGIEHKRQDILLEILAESKWKKRDIHLNLYGKGVHEQSLKNLTNYYQLSNVSFKGHVENISNIWSCNHAFVLPSRYEGVSLAMQEALISYRTCIVTQVGGVSTLVKDNVTGFVAPAATTPLFEEAMERAWNRLDEWESIGKAAGELARNVLPSDPVNYLVDDLLTLI